MAVTDLTNTTWIINDTPEVLGSAQGIDFNINFNSNNSNFIILNMHNGNDGIIRYVSSGSYNDVYNDNNGWTNNNYKTIEITGGTDATNVTLIAWLSQNASQVIPSYTITSNLTNISSSNTNYEIEDGGTWTTTLTADAGYVLPESITVVGATASYNSSTGALTLSNPTGNVILTASAVIIPPEDKRLVTYEDLLEFKKQLMTVLYQYRCGYYDPNIEYSVGEFAWYEQRIYLCKVATTAGILPTNTSYWIPLVVNE